MIRVAGSVLLLCASAALGFGAVNGLKEHVKQLSLLISALEEMERELGARLTPMPELLQRLADHSEGAVAGFFFLSAASLNGLGERGFSALWGDALKAANLRLEKEEQVLLEELGNSLGRYDSRSQQAAIRQTLGRLEERLNLAAERRERLGRVYGTLGLAVGTLLVIILI